MGFFRRRGIVVYSVSQQSGLLIRVANALPSRKNGILIGDRFDDPLTYRPYTKLSHTSDRCKPRKNGILIGDRFDDPLTYRPYTKLSHTSDRCKPRFTILIFGATIFLRNTVFKELDYAPYDTALRHMLAG